MKRALMYTAVFYAGCVVGAFATRQVVLYMIDLVTSDEYNAVKEGVTEALSDK